MKIQQDRCCGGQVSSLARLLPPPSHPEADGQAAMAVQRALRRVFCFLWPEDKEDLPKTQKLAEDEEEAQAYAFPLRSSLSSHHARCYDTQPY